MPTTTTDRIEKRIFLRASRERVWRAISDSREFGTWFLTQRDMQIPAETKEFAINHSNARLWEIMLRLRLADRWWQRRVRRRIYPFLLPGPTRR